MADGQIVGGKRSYLCQAIALAGGVRSLFAAVALSAAVNLAALVGPAYMLMLYGHALPTRGQGELLAATAAMLVLYAVGATFDFARQTHLRRCARRIDRSLTILAARRSAAMPMRELAAIRSTITGGLAAAACDLMWVPLFFGLLLLLHPLLCLLAVAGATSITACALLANGADGAHRPRERGTEEQAARRLMLGAAIARALRPALQSTMLGLGAYLVMTQSCHPASALAAAIILPRLLGPIETLLADRRTMRAALDSARRLAMMLAAAPVCVRAAERPLPASIASAGITIVLRRSGDYARNATRGVARSMSSDLRPTAQ